MMQWTETFAACAHRPAAIYSAACPVTTIQQPLEAGLQGSNAVLLNPKLSTAVRYV